MPKSPLIQKRINETCLALKQMGLPEKTKRKEETRALAVLACAGLLPSEDWTSLKNVDQHALTTRQIISFVNENYEESIAAGSYDDVRRSWLLDPRNANIVVTNKPNASQNDPTRAWGLSRFATETLSSYGTPNWAKELKKWASIEVNLATEMKKIRELNRTKVIIPNGTQIDLGPGSHNGLIREIIEEFLPRYGFDSNILYVGDAETRTIILEEKKLKKLGFFKLGDTELPDVVAYSQSKNWLYLIEAVTSSGPMSFSRTEKLTKALSKCTADLIFVTAFPDRTILRKHVADLAWETEVWLSTDPDHLIHLNGDKFLGPHVLEDKN